MDHKVYGYSEKSRIHLDYTDYQIPVQICRTRISEYRAQDFMFNNLPNNLYEKEVDSIYEAFEKQ